MENKSKPEASKQAREALKTFEEYLYWRSGASKRPRPPEAELVVMNQVITAALKAFGASNPGDKHRMELFTQFLSAKGGV